MLLSSALVLISVEKVFSDWPTFLSASVTTTPPAEPVGRTAWGGATGALLDAARRKKNRSSSTRSAAVSPETASHLQRDKEMLMEEVKAQKVRTLPLTANPSRAWEK